MRPVTRFVAAATVALLACESAANLEVVYRRDGVAALDGGEDAAGDAGHDAEAGAPPLGEFEGCPCDQTQGLGCCVTPGGGQMPFCTADDALCDQQRGALWRCFRPDFSTESLCCTHPRGSALAAVCDGGIPTCLTAADCPSGPCSTTECNGIVIGACSVTAPACP